MAKRITAALCLILLSLSLACGSYLYIKNTSEEIIALSDVIIEKQLGGEDISAAFGKLLLTWDSNSELFGVILKHSDADVIGRYFLELESAKVCADEEKIYNLLTELKAFLTVTLRGEAPAIENIF